MTRCTSPFLYACIQRDNKCSRIARQKGCEPEMAAILFLRRESGGWKNLDQAVKQGGSDQIGTTILFMVHFSHKMLFVLKCFVYDIVCHLHSFLVQNGQKRFKAYFPNSILAIYSCGDFSIPTCSVLLIVVCCLQVHIIYTIRHIEKQKQKHYQVFFIINSILYLFHLICFLCNTCSPVHSCTFNVLSVADPCWN